MTEAILDHLIITAPDRCHGEGLKILWIDWQFDQVENCLNMLRASPIRLMFHMFGPNDNQSTWLIDVAHQADIIIMNMGINSAVDVIKGHMIAWNKTFYFGRKDLQEIFPGYIDDPQGKMLVWVGEQVERGNNG